MFVFTVRRDIRLPEGNQHIELSQMWLQGRRLSGFSTVLDVRQAVGKHVCMMTGSVKSVCSTVSTVVSCGGCNTSKVVASQVGDELLQLDWCTQ
ncbi:MAG: hypothetical protein ACKESB_03680 [Candidatus Hodgkinia cicadicola]